MQLPNARTLAAHSVLYRSPSVQHAPLSFRIRVTRFHKRQCPTQKERGLRKLLMSIKKHKESEINLISANIFLIQISRNRDIDKTCDNRIKSVSESTISGRHDDNCRSISKYIRTLRDGSAMCPANARTAEREIVAPVGTRVCRQEDFALPFRNSR